MDKNIFHRNELLARKVIKGLESRNMSGYYAASREEALQLALTLIPEGSSVTMGGGMSAFEIGLVDALKTDAYNFIDRAERVWRGEPARQTRSTVDVQSDEDRETSRAGAM